MTPVTATLIVVAIGLVGGASIYVIASEFSSVDSDKCEFGAKTYKNMFGFEKTECYTSENTPMSSKTPEITITHFEWDSYGTMIVFSDAIQGLIGEINKEQYNNGGYEITFASGNRYVMDNVRVKLEVGDIITINKNSIARNPCEVKIIELSNGTVYVNDRESEYYQDERFVLLSDDDIEQLLNKFQWSIPLSNKYMNEIAPYYPHSTCTSYTVYEFVSLDSKIASMESIK